LSVSTTHLIFSITLVCSYPQLLLSKFTARSRIRTDSHVQATVNASSAQRRSTRIRWEIPIRITSLDPSQPFMESCQTLVVNPQGCGIRLTRSISIGAPVQLDGLPGVGSVMAKVANCISLGAESKLWLVGLALDEPGNVWGVQSPPEDWDTSPARIPAPVATPDPKKKQNWPYTQFSRRGEFHPGRR